MEISITGLGRKIDESQARLKLISEISSVVHHWPLRRSPDETPINFDVSIQHHQLGQRAPPAVHWYLTFPSISFGQRFLDHLKNDNTRAAAFGPTLAFVLSTTRIGKSAKRTPKVPHPGLVYNLKNTVFRDPEAERAFLEESKLSNENLSLAVLCFGRINNNQAFSSEFKSDLTPTQASLQFNPESASLVVVLNLPNAPRQTLSMHFKTIERIEADWPSIILFLTCPPILTEHPMEHNLLSFGMNFSLPTGKPKKRVSSFNVDQARVLPFTGKLIRLTFANEHHSRRFISQRSHYRLPRIINHFRQVVEEGIYSPRNLALWQAYLSQTDIRISFLLDLLVYNHYFDLLNALKVSQRLKNVPIEEAERALINLISQLGNSIDEALNTTSDRQNVSEAGLTKLNAQSSTLMAKLEAVLSNPTIARHPLKHCLEENGLFRCRSLTITPTGLVFELPSVDESNSVLRHYGRPECFIRVAFRDEDGSPHRVERETDLRGFLRDRYLHFLTNGIRVAGRKFEFLGYSSSALKDHQTWFVCPFLHDRQLISAELIRRLMGDFSRVNRIPARYMARIAQAFTTTRKALTLKPDQLLTIPDVSRNGSLFTDGVGTISPALSQRVESALAGAQSSSRLRNSNRSTCYQIRLGGFKGMLSLDSNLVGEMICLRPSMDKFDAADSLTLNIAGTFRRPLNAYLNRPLIKILEDLRIQPEVFLRLQRHAVSVIEDARKSFAGASELFDRHGLGDPAGLPRLLSRLAKLEGIEIDGCGFLEECLDLAVVHCLKDLKYRGRIPLHGSYNLVGVADEDEVLEPNQIYASVRMPGSRSRTFLTGKIAISRSPCIHPGDVQVVTAIGRPPAQARRLASLVNCVVFSVKGTRSLPSCLGGGDLDGDLYTLITDPNLIPHTFNIHPPAKYAPPKMFQLGNPCTIVDGAIFFLNYIASDLVGVISNRHLQIADASIFGSKDPDCLELSQLHSDAVDYAKTGVAVNYTELPKTGKARPDFMSPEFITAHQRSTNDKYYESTKVLGRLFRDIPVAVLEEDTMKALRRQRRGDQSGRAGLDDEQTLTRAIESLMIDELGWVVVDDDDDEKGWMDEMRCLAQAFGEEYWKICRLNTLGSLGMRTAGTLSESEAFMGVIAASSTDRREKRETMVRLVNQTTELFEMLRSEIIGEIEEEEGCLEDWVSSIDLNDNESLMNYNSSGFSEREEKRKEVVIRRAWAAWKVSCKISKNEMIESNKSLGVVVVQQQQQSPPKWFGVRSFGLIALDLILKELQKKDTY